MTGQRKPSEFEAWRPVDKAHHASVAGSAVGRFEVARLVNRPGEILVVTRIWQSASIVGSSGGAPQANEVRDPAFLLNAGVTVRWNLVIESIDDPDGEIEAFPVANAGVPATAVPFVSDQPAGWINAPFKYLWGDQTPQRLVVLRHAAVRLFCDVATNPNVLRSVSGFLRGEARAFEDKPDFWAWFHSRS